MDASALDEPGTVFPGEPAELWKQWVLVGRLPNTTYVAQTGRADVQAMVQFAEEVAAAMLLPLRDTSADGDAGVVTRYTPADPTGSHLAPGRKRARGHDRSHTGGSPDPASAPRVVLPHEYVTQLSTLEQTLTQLTAHLSRCKTSFRNCSRAIEQHVAEAPAGAPVGAGAGVGTGAGAPTGSSSTAVPSAAPSAVFRAPVASSASSGAVAVPGRGGADPGLEMALVLLRSMKTEVTEAKTKSVAAFRAAQTLRETMQSNSTGELVGAWGDVHGGGFGAVDGAEAPETPSVYRMNPLVRAEIAALQDSVNKPGGAIRKMALRLMESSTRLVKPRRDNLEKPLHVLVSNSNIATALKAISGVKAGMAARAVNAAATYLGQTRDDTAGKQLMALEAKAATAILESEL